LFYTIIGTLSKFTRQAKNPTGRELFVAYAHPGYFCFIDAMRVSAGVNNLEYCVGRRHMNAVILITLLSVIAGRKPFYLSILPAWHLTGLRGVPYAVRWSTRYPAFAVNANADELREGRRSGTCG
jgi:hypothetical protein